MKYNKGDLIAIKTLDDQKDTAIIVSNFGNGYFLYCYCINSGEYRLVYQKEVEFLIVPRFDVDFPPDSEFFDIDYSFYEACIEVFSYSPFHYPLYSPMDSIDEDSSEDQ